MNDPYQVLGVSPNASDEDIKKAYRDLARRYHPDNYHDNPLADLAQEKMKEINEAYDTICKSREGGGGYSAGASGAYSRQNSGSSAFQAVRNLLRANNIQAAENMLRGISGRNAEWNYLMGVVSQRKGWMDDALQYYQTAVQMEPMNAEYRNALNGMNNGGQFYRQYGNTGNAVSNVDFCDVCSTIYCADCCCEMMGGDLCGCF